MIGHRVSQAKNGGLTRRCKAVTTDGPCKNWSEYDFCHVHEWKMNSAVMSTRQSFVLLFPRAVARLARIIDEPDGELALKAIMVCFKYMLGDKLATDGMANSNPLADLTAEELVVRAQRAIAAVQHPSPEGGGSEQAAAAAAAGLSVASDTAPGTGQPPAPGTGLDASDGAITASETGELSYGGA